MNQGSTWTTNYEQELTPPPMILNSARRSFTLLANHASPLAPIPVSALQEEGELFVAQCEFGSQVDDGLAGAKPDRE